MLRISQCHSVTVTLGHLWSFYDTLQCLFLWQLYYFAGLFSKLTHKGLNALRFIQNVTFSNLYHVQTLTWFAHLTDVPGPPSAPAAEEVTKETCKLSWTAPEDDGGSPVTGYFVERCQTTSSRWLRVTKEPVSDTTYKVTDLIEDTEYKFRIAATNKVGEGEPGPESKPIIAKDPWS